MVNSVLVGTDENGLSVHRRRVRWQVDEVVKLIRIEYEQFFVVNAVEIGKVDGLCYFVRDVMAGEDPNETGTPMVADFLGYSDWDNYNIGGLPNGVRLGKDVISPKIDATLQVLPIVVKNGHVLTQGI